jgi:hypothetical protein
MRDWRNGGGGWLTLLSTTQLLDSLLVVVLAIEADANADTDVIFDTLLSLLVF